MILQYRCFLEIHINSIQIDILIDALLLYIQDKETCITSISHIYETSRMQIIVFVIEYNVQESFESVIGNKSIIFEKKNKSESMVKEVIDKVLKGEKLRTLSIMQYEIKRLTYTWLDNKPEPFNVPNEIAMSIELLTNGIENRSQNKLIEKAPGHLSLNISDAVDNFKMNTNFKPVSTLPSLFSKYINKYTQENTTKSSEKDKHNTTQPKYKQDSDIHRDKAKNKKKNKKLYKFINKTYQK